MGLKISELNTVQRSDMGCFQNDFWRTALLKRFLPARGAQTPPIAGLKTWKAPLRVRCAEVISSCL